MEWAELITSANPVTVILALIIVLLTGGVGAAIVQSFAAGRRGIKGDALVKESNGIQGMKNLSDAQGQFIEDIRTQATEDKAELQKKISALETKLIAVEEKASESLDHMQRQINNEIAYSNQLIALLISKDVTPPARPE